MGRKSRLPIIIDELPSITAGPLRKAGFFKEGQLNGGFFYVGGVEVRAVGVMNDNDSRLEIGYNYEGQRIRDTIPLVSRLSNLGKGTIYEFICPISGKKARKLSFYGGRFVHFSVLPGALYRKQTRSHKWREMDKRFAAYFELDSCYDQLNDKYFKKYCRGRPTKRYMKILNKISQAEQIDPQQLIDEFENWKK
ncbi:hypothetical protein HPE56_10605 [Maribacter sp. ANRC-HE7]|uniref:Uncharacterized protein n=1 Tax=Maribacter aquimaris TaxID=2737171 RepID=A0ABR7V081_9FLAO|nr:hypothetical protein [Maribacter aquimaris]MBD0778244.1 hypothetical protein [Maribacter aquimaris]